MSETSDGELIRTHIAVCEVRNKALDEFMDDMRAHANASVASMLQLQGQIAAIHSGINKRSWSIVAGLGTALIATVGLAVALTRKYIFHV